jgi:cell pole-organizing protein PopZ
MEEILASIRRIIADDDASKSQPKPSDPLPPPPTPMTQAPRPAASPPSRPAPPAHAPERKMQQDEIDAMLTELTAPSPSPSPARAAAHKPSSSDVLDLTEAMAASARVRADGFRTIDGESDVVFEDIPEEEETAPQESMRERAPAPPAEEPHRHMQAIDERALLSSMTSQAVDSAFNTLAHTVLVQNARTLEDLVREMLRPLLKTWLDDNLPGLVERLVRAEIERVSRGRS